MKKASRVTQFITVLISLSLSAYLSAKPQGHYRWTDEKGTVQYSDRPPEGIESEFVKFTTSKRSSNSGGKVAETSNKTSGAEKDQAQSDAMEVLPEKDPALCKKAQNNLKALEGARIRMTDTDGTQRFLNEDEKEIQRENARKFIKLYC